MLTELVSSGLQAARSPGAIEAEALLKAYDSQINLWSGSDRQFSKMNFPKMSFYLKEFEDKKSLEDYIAHPDYGHSKDKPGVCLGLTLKENAKNKYELEIFANDAIVLDYRSIPD